MGQRVRLRHVGVLRPKSYTTDPTAPLISPYFRRSPAQAHQLLAFATTKIPGEIRAKYLRDQRISTVRADVRVDAIDSNALVNFRGVVHVEVTYKGDMVISSKRTREKINDRLQWLAQQHCAQSVYKEILDGLER